jgi:hypothetical protein
MVNDSESDVSKLCSHPFRPEDDGDLLMITNPPKLDNNDAEYIESGSEDNCRNSDNNKLRLEKKENVNGDKKKLKNKIIKKEVELDSDIDNIPNIHKECNSNKKIKKKKALYELKRTGKTYISRKVGKNNSSGKKIQKNKKKKMENKKEKINKEDEQ